MKADRGSLSSLRPDAFHSIVRVYEMVYWRLQHEPHNCSTKEQRCGRRYNVSFGKQKYFNWICYTSGRWWYSGSGARALSISECWFGPPRVTKSFIPAWVGKLVWHGALSISERWFGPPRLTKPFIPSWVGKLVLASPGDEQRHPLESDTVPA